VTVGGDNKRNEAVNEVYTYEESLKTRKWKQIIPPMPTARSSPGVLSLKSALIVAGGALQSNKYNSTAIVEIFKPDTSQWYRTCVLPTNNSSETLQLVAIGDKIYTLGGSELDHMFVASVDDLLRYAVPAAANQITHIASRDDTHQKLAWKELCEIESYAPAVSVLAGNLLTLGGGIRYMCGLVYTYSPSTNSWIHICDAPFRQAGAAVAVLSSTDILVIGGWLDEDKILERLNSVYRGTLHFRL
jgi:hypothetical protein